MVTDRSRFVTDIIDLSEERNQREQHAQEVAQGTDVFVSGLHHAGDSLAKLAWTLAAPVRHHDRELKEGIYKLLLKRLKGIVISSFDGMNVAPQVIERTTEIACAAFQARLLALAAMEQAGKLST